MMIKISSTLFTLSLLKITQIVRIPESSKNIKKSHEIIMNKNEVGN
jgi:hypothetical protein